MSGSNQLVVTPSLPRILLQKSAGFIGCVGHQDVVALLNECQNGVGNRRRAAREERASGAAFQFTHGFLERKVGQRSPASVK